MNNASSLLPGRNPTGTSVAGDYSIIPATGSSSGANPFVTPTNLPPTAPGGNPYDPSPVPTFGANSGGYSPTNLAPTTSPTTGSTALQPLGTGPGLSGMTPKGLNDMYHELNKTYGEGTASAIMNFLSSGAGFNQDAVNNLLAALQPGIERGTESLMEQFSTSGNRFGSGAQIGLADYLSQVNLNEGQIEAQMYETSVNDYINTLMGVANRNSTRVANSPSTMDTLLQSLKLGGAAAGGASAAGVGGTAGSILDIIASLGAAA
jgi:hypothetical protein